MQQARSIDNLNTVLISPDMTSVMTIKTNKNK